MEKKAPLKGASSTVEFEGKEISLDISTTEVTESGGWKLQPMHIPVVISNECIHYMLF